MYYLIAGLVGEHASPLARCWIAALQRWIHAIHGMNWKRVETSEQILDRDFRGDEATLHLLRTSEKLYINELKVP